VTSPATLVHEYVGGRRRTYVNPARFCLLSLALWFFVMHVAGVDPIEWSGISVTASSSGTDDPGLVQDMRAVLSRNLELLQYLALPVLGLLLRWLFRKRGRNFAECLVLVLYVAGLRYLFMTLLIPIELAVDRPQTELRAVAGFAWFTWTARGFFGASTWSAAWRMLLALTLHKVATILLCASIVIPYVLLR
jgi:hypothetical protein